MGGSTYNFRLRARNIHGWSPDTANPTSILASGVPDQPVAPTTSLDSLNVVITWTQPEPNYGGITAYKVNLINSAGTASEESTYCDGSQTAILTSRSCQVPMAYIRT